MPPGTSPKPPSSMFLQRWFWSRAYIWGSWPGLHLTYPIHLRGSHLGMSFYKTFPVRQMTFILSQALGVFSDLQLTKTTWLPQLPQGELHKPHHSNAC